MILATTVDEIKSRIQYFTDTYRLLNRIKSETSSFPVDGHTFLLVKISTRENN